MLLSKKATVTSSRGLHAPSHHLGCRAEYGRAAFAARSHEPDHDWAIHNPGSPNGLGTRGLRTESLNLGIELFADGQADQ